MAVLRFGHPARPGTTWDRQDLVGTLRALGPWWDLLGEGVPHAVLDELRCATLAALGSADLTEGGIQGCALAVADAPQPTAVLGPVVDACLALLSDAGRAVAAAGHGAPAASGVVASVHASGGGVPKPLVQRADVGWRGVEGDRQRNRKHHGRVWQALCLWSMERIEGLEAEGHPIGPGCAGENLTFRGIDMSTLRPGTILRVGEVVCEISLPAVPCKNLVPWFADGDFRRIQHERHPGWSRLYATVVQPGRVQVGDPVEVEPA